MGEPMRFAALTPFAANWLLRQVPAERWRSSAEGARQSGRPDLGRELEGARAQLAAAAEQWRAVVEGLPPGGSGEVPEGVDGRRLEGPPTDPESPRGMGSAQVGKLLGVTARQVRNLLESGALRGELVAGRWVVDEDSVVEFFHLRQEQCDGGTGE